MLSDNDALRTKRWLEDIENDFASPDLINPYMRGVIESKRNKLSAYEENAALNNRPTYIPDPRKTLENIPYYQGAMKDGGEGYFGKDFSLFDTAEKRADTVAPLYISDLSGIDPSEVRSKLPSYRQYYMNKHGVNNFATALQMDMEQTNEKSSLISELYQHASDASARAVSDPSLEGRLDQFKAMSEFIDSKGEDFSMDEEMAALYRDSYVRNLEIYQKNSKSFEKLTGLLKEATDDTLSPSLVAMAALALNDIDPKMRGHALKYAEMQVEGGAEGLKTLFAISSEAIRQKKSGTDYTDIVEKVYQLSSDMVKGEDVEVLKGLPLKTGNAFAAIANVSGASRSDGIRVLSRKATEEEKDQLWRDLQVAGEYAASIDTIEEFVREKTTDVSGLDWALTRHLYDKMLFPTLESLPYMVEYGSYAVGGAGISGGMKAIGVGSKLLRGGVSAAFVTKGTERAYARNRFKDLVKQYPEMDKALALNVAMWEGRSEAAVAALGNIIQIRQLPQPLRKALSGSVAGVFKKTIIGRTLMIGGVEVAEEVLQDLSAGLTRNIYSAFINEDVPGREDLFAVLGELDDISWAVLPMAMMGGLSGKFIKPSYRADALSNRDKLMKTFGDEEVVEQILNAETHTEREAIYTQNYNAKKHAEVIKAAIEEEGAVTSDFVSEEAVKAAEEADSIESDPGLREPQIIPIDTEQGQEAQRYAIVYEDGRRETHDSFISAVERLVDYKETGEVQTELKQKKLLDLDAEKSQLEQEIAELERQKADPKEAKRESRRKIAGKDTGNKYVDKAKQHFVEGKDPNTRDDTEKALRENVGDEAADAYRDEYNRLRDEQVAQKMKEKTDPDVDAQITEKKKRLDEIDEEIAREKEVPKDKPKPKDEPTPKKKKDEDLDEHANNNGNKTKEDTDEQGKPSKVVDKKPKQDSEAGENLNTEELRIDHKFVDEYMPKLAEKLLSEKEASVWKAEFLDIIKSPNWISSAQSRLKVLLGEISDKGRPDAVRYNDQQLLMLYQRHLMQERSSASMELAKALAENNKAEVTRIRNLLVSREKEINDITAVLFKVGSFAGKVLVQRQASLDFEEVGAVESVKRSYRTIVGKEPSSAIDKQIESKANELKDLHKKRLEILQESAKLHAKNVADGASETVNQSKSDAKKENLSREDAINKKNELLRKVLKAADKHNWCIGG